jgi:SAM-dependent methyltransferase
MNNAWTTGLAGVWEAIRRPVADHDGDMTALPPDYDTDPGRWASLYRRSYLQADVHELVADRLVRADAHPVLDVGCGDGQLAAVLPEGWPWIGVDSSPAQLRRLPRGGVALADAARLPIADGSVPAVTALWMLYHLDHPEIAIAEARRVLRDGGLFFACTSARDNDPELTDGYPATTFDAEEAPDLVRAVFGPAVEVLVWDKPLVRLGDRPAVVRYLRSHHLPPSRVDEVRTPLTLTKRGCLVVARKIP